MNYFNTPLLGGGGCGGLAQREAPPKAALHKNPPSAVWSRAPPTSPTKSGVLPLKGGGENANPFPSPLEGEGLYRGQAAAEG